MFVTDKSFRRNPKTIIYDKELLAMGNKSERLVLQLLELLSNPKAVTPHTNTFSMDKERNFVTQDTVCVQVTPAQQKLLKLISHVEAEDHFKCLKNVHYVATYCSDVDLLELWQNGYVHQLMDVIHAIYSEELINQLKSA